MLRLILAPILAVAACGTVPSPTLPEVLGRVDVPRLLRCAEHEDWGERARCVGAQAATAGLRFAFDQALKLAERAAESAGPGGTDDMSDAERQALARQLDVALVDLGREVARAQGDGP